MHTLHASLCGTEQDSVFNYVLAEFSVGSAV